MKMRLESLAVVHMLLVLVNVNASSSADSNVGDLKKTLETTKQERNTLKERVAELERQESEDEITIRNMENDLKDCEKENTEHDKKIKTDLKQYMDIYKTQRDIVKSKASCEEEITNIEKERDEVQQELKDLKTSFGKHIDIFQKQLKDFMVEDRDRSWNDLAELYGQCWTSQKLKELGGTEKGDIATCQQFIEESKKSVEKCFGQLSDCQSKEGTLSQQQDDYEKAAQSLELKAVQLSAEVEEIQKDGECTCENDEELEKYKSMFTHYIDQFHTCKLQKQSHKVLKWYMAKELTALKHKVLSLQDELIDIKKTSKKDLKVLSKTMKEMDQLNKDFSEVQKLYEKTDKELTKKSAEAAKCMNEWEQTDFLQRGTEMVMNQLEEKEKELKKEKKKATAISQKAMDEALKHRMYFGVCVIIIFTILCINAYFLTKDKYEAYKERLREEKSTLRKERRETKGKKVKRH